MTTQDPKDTRQRQSLTGAMAQPPPSPQIDMQGLQKLVQQQTGEMNPVQKGLEAGASSVLERRRQRKMAQEPPDLGPEVALTPVPSQQAPAQETVPAPVPAGAGPMVEVQRQTTAKSVDPKLQSAAEEALKKEAELRDAQQNLVKAQQEDLQAEADIRQAQAAQEQTQAQLLNGRLEQMRIRQEQAMQQYNQAFDKYAQAEVQNPWEKASTGSKVMAGLAMLLGGLSGPGGLEAVQKTIDSNIQRDIELQKANLNKKKGELTMLQQHARELQAMGMNDINIAESMGALANKAVARQLEAIAATRQASDPAGAARIAQLGANYANRAMEIQQKVAQDAQVTSVEKPLFTQLGEADKGKDLDKDTRNIMSGRIKALKLLNQIKEQVQSPEYKRVIGPIAGPMFALKAKYLGDEEAATMIANTRKNILAALREATGAQMTDAERKFISETEASTNESFESFMAKLNSSIDRIEDNYQSDLELLNKQGYNMAGFDPLTRPQALKDSVGFKGR